MNMYLVVRYVDELEKDERGINDSYYAIGLFPDEETAKSVKETEMETNPVEYDDEVAIIPIEVGKVYQESERPYIGGGMYVE